MSPIDWRHGDYHVVFRANAREDAFSWAGDAATTDDAATGALAVLGRLWCPVSVELDVGGGGESEFAVCEIDGDPDPVRVAGEVAATVRRIARGHAGWGLQMIGPALDGWARLALPSGAEAPERWTLVSDDEVVVEDVAWCEGPQAAGNATVWLRLGAPAASSDIEVQRLAAGRLLARLRLGAVFFTPGLELRDPDTDVLGAPVSDWQAANAVLHGAVVSDLEAAGWRVVRT